MTAPAALMPCPFCGGEAQTEPDASGWFGTFATRCIACQASSAWQPSEVEAITARNARASDEARLLATEEQLFNEIMVWQEYGNDDLAELASELFRTFSFTYRAALGAPEQTED